MSVIRLLLLVLAMATAISAAQAQETCEQLVAFRDGDLLKQWDVAAAKYRYNAEARADIADLKKQLQNDTAWAASDIGGLVGAIASNIKVTTDLIGDLLGFVPATGAISRTGSTLRDFSGKAVKAALDGGIFMYDVAEDGIEITTTKFLMSQLNPVAHAAKTAWTLADNLQKAATFPSDHKKLQRELKQAVDRLDKAMMDFDAKIANAAERIEYVNAIKNGIDEKCARQDKTAANPECEAKQKQIVAIGQACQADPQTCRANEALAIHDWLRDNQCPGIYSSDSSFQGGTAMGVGKQSQACIDINNKLMAAANAGDLDTINALTPQVGAACKQ